MFKFDANNTWSPKRFLHAEIHLSRMDRFHCYGQIFVTIPNISSWKYRVIINARNKFAAAYVRTKKSRKTYHCHCLASFWNSILNRLQSLFIPRQPICFIQPTPVVLLMQLKCIFEVYLQYLVEKFFFGYSVRSLFLLHPSTAELNCFSIMRYLLCSSIFSMLQFFEPPGIHPKLFTYNEIK